MKATKEKEVKKATPKVTKAKPGEAATKAIKEKAKKESDKIKEKTKQLKAKKEVAEKLSAPIVEIEQPPLPEMTQKKKIGRPKGEPKPPKEPGRRGRPPKLDSEPKVTKPLQMLLYPAEYEQYKQSGQTARQLFMLGLEAHNKIINDVHKLGMESKPVLE